MSGALDQESRLLGLVCNMTSYASCGAPISRLTPCEGECCHASTVSLILPTGTRRGVAWIRGSADRS